MATNAKPAKAKKKKANTRSDLEKSIAEIKYTPSQRNWEELLKRANGDAKLAKQIGNSWMFWALERRKIRQLETESK